MTKISGALMEKLGFGIVDARKAVTALKKTTPIIKRTFDDKSIANGGLTLGGKKQTGMFAINKPASFGRQQNIVAAVDQEKMGLSSTVVNKFKNLFNTTRAARQSIKRTSEKQLLDHISKQTDQLKPLLHPIKTNKGIYKGRGGTTLVINDFAKKNPFLRLPKNLDSKNKEMVNRIGMLHEGFETSVKPKDAIMVDSHLSPNVLYKEHNLLTTLPKKYQATKDTFKAIRPRGVGVAVHHPNLVYGESPRLSRHAIKRLTEIDNKEWPKVIKQSLDQ